MKSLYTIFFILISLTSFSQKRNDKNRNIFPEVYLAESIYQYVLLDSTHFYFSTAHFCGSSPTGRGTYKKTEKNQIEFSFRQTPTPQDVKITYPKIGSENSAKIKIDFTIYEDSINNPLLGANIYYEKHGIKSGTSTDFDGKASLTIDTTLFNDTIYIQYIGLPKVKLVVKPESQHVEMTLTTEYPFEVFDEKRKFKINHRKKRIIPIEEE